MLLKRFTGGREIYALADQALVSGSNFATNVMLARALGLSGFGVFALCWTVIMLLGNVQMSLLILPMMSLGPKQQLEDTPYYLGAVLINALSLATACSLIVYLGARILILYSPRLGLETLALPLAFAGGSFLLQDFARRYFFIIQRSALALGSDAISYMTQLPILCILAITKHLTAPVAIWVIALTSLVSALISYTWRGHMIIYFPIAFKVAKDHWKTARWLFPSSVLQWASLNLVTVFAPVYYGAQAAGAMRACQNIVAVAHIWFLGLDNIVPSEAARRLHHHGVGAALRYLQRTIWSWGLLTLTFMSVIFAFAPLWLRLLYGARFTSFAYVLQLYCVLYLFLFVGGPLRAGLQAIEYTVPVLWSYIAMTIFASFTAAPMAKRYGVVGVMAGLILSQILFQAILACAFFRRIKVLRQEENTAFASAAI